MPRLKSRKSAFLATLLVSCLLMVTACGPSAPSDNVQTQGTPAEAEVEIGDKPQESVVAVNFADDRMSPETIQVKQGDNVTLNLETDRPGSFHIHGYDLEKEAAVGEVTEFQFEASATGRFRINFHGMAEPANTMDHGPMESAVPVAIDISATAAMGGVHVQIKTEGWRWAPEEVNGANNDGAGHAHIYADGVKLSRVYGDYHYLPAPDPGNREIRVSLNSNDHNELTWEGSKLESTVMVTVPEMVAVDYHDMGSMKEPVEAEAPMSLEVIVHEDELGGYNLQAIPKGFEFTRSLGETHEPGKGYALLSIDGEVFNRFYVPWFQVPAQGEGMHTFTVALLNNEGQPYRLNGEPVEVSEMVHEEAKAEVADHHDSGSSASTDHHGGGTTAGAANIVELEVGYLEVLP